MNRKAFLIWGLVIISFYPIASAITGFLALSNIIDAKRAATNLVFTCLIGVTFAFGVVLHLRFKKIGRRKRILTLCIFLYMLSLTITPFNLATLYNDYIVTNSAAYARFHAALGEWTKSDIMTNTSPWSLKHKIDYILVMLPGHYLVQIGLFALLWFGSLDPRIPSKSKIIQFMKTGFQRKSKNRTNTQPIKMVAG